MPILQSRHLHRALASSAAVLALTLPALSQEQGEVIQLETVVVEGGAGGAQEGSAAAEALVGTGPVDGYVAPATTTGSKTTTPVIEIPQSISVITRDQLDDRNVQTLGQALTYSAGVLAEPFGNDVRYTAPIIRGFEATDSVYLNSFRFFRDFGALAFEPYGQERIEVLRGPASVLYGQGEPGGIINVIAKRPTFTEFREFGAEIGTNSRYVAKFDVGGVADANETLSYRLTGLGRLADGQQDFITDDRVYIAPSLTWAPDNDTSLTVLGSLQYDTGTSQLGLPLSGTIYSNPNGELPRSRYSGEPGFNDNESWLGTLGTEFRHRFNETFEFRQNIQFVSFDADFNNLYTTNAPLIGDRIANRGVNVQSERTTSIGFDNQLEAQFETGPLQHTAVVGLDYRHSKQWRSSNFSGSVAPIDVFDPVYGAPVTVNPAGANITDVRLSQVGLYVQDQIRYDRLVVSLGARHDWADVRNLENGLASTDNAFTGRVGAVYLFDNGLAPFVSYSTSFSPQTDVVYGQSVLEASEGEQIEAGVKIQPLGWTSFLTASVYDLTKTNIAAQVPNPDGPGTVTSQIGEVRSRGFEIEATASLAEGLDLLAAYTYTDAEITQGDLSDATTTGNRPQNVPEHAASLWLDYSFAQNTALEGVSIGGGVRYVGSRFADNANTIDLPSATVFDAAIRYEKANFTAALNVNNIADERYVATCSFYGCFYGEGRSVIGSVGYKW